MGEGDGKRPNDGNFRTRELTLAAYLVHNEFNYVDIEQRLNEAVWVFAKTPELIEEVDKFNSRKAQVEPRAYHSDLAGVRKALYHWLQDHGLFEQRRAPTP